ncbi:TetR/AcrR family transcriptional regulator [Paenibacillus amylolyticus]|uniref:TetR/AcrR family transcriptional regulator n=1 Tax=Paenibacillus amylolyticus TaxID=1451 RepID=UPI00249C79D6|nr:TetR/AcrR family transcriptional regulator [Paenibacillus amylolyticus]WFA86446.1 TetR/AcrR family transcriptional regulator [Paenibacillus amylolyticus]
MSGVLSPNSNDPRVIRTRQLILDAFINQLNIKNFNSITIQNITEQATINRATFYAHFQDKYALLEAFLADAFMEYVTKRVNPDARLSAETIQQLIFSLCDYHVSSNGCIKKYETVAPIIEENIKTQLEQFLLELLSKVAGDVDPKTLKITATTLSWSIYGMTYRWNIEGGQESPAELANRVVPYMMGGLELLN